MANADRLIEIFNEARARRAGAERAEYLAQVCADESELKEQVLSLLQADEEAGDFLIINQASDNIAALTEKPGDTIGRYKLLEKIGEGGCGVVYMAEQEQPVRRRVALKVIKLGMDTRQVIARFEAERQALALMDHPNIAKVLDAGATEAGRPFFVMELVRGIRITEYCDENNLSTTDRLGLFIQVCQAIQHAHQKGIIHRDIKPSNILVTQNESVAVPKVIDFGIAKATTDQRLTDKTVFTAFEQFIGTPAYMSPEQAMMTSLDIDTRADIYSLGVLLYELLTGHTPFDARELLAAGMDEMRRKIREDEPVKPSSCLSTMQAMDLTMVAKRRRVEPPGLIHSIRGDLDWLVMKCLEKNRTRRYETANALALDLQRHLNNEPVLACPPSNFYRFQKMVRRNKLSFAAATAVVAALVLGLGVSTWMFLKERQARETARIEAIKSEQVARFMTDMLKGAGPAAALGRDTAMLREILDQTAQRLNELKGQPAVEADLRSTLGDTYFDLGNFTNAAAMHREALTLRKSFLGNQHPAIAASLNSLAGVLWRLGRLKEAETMYRETLAMRRKVLGIDHLDVAQTLLDLSLLHREQKNWPAAESTVRESLRIYTKLLGDEHGSIAYALHLLAWNVYVQGRHSEAEALSRQELAMRRKLQGNEDPNGLSALFDLAIFLHDQGKSGEAEAVVAEITALRKKVLVLKKENPDTAQFIHHLGWVFEHLGRRKEAEEVYREELALRRKVVGNDHPKVATTLFTLGRLLQNQRKFPEAETVVREAVAIQRKGLGDDHPDVANSLAMLSLLLREQNKLTEAESTAREALAAKRKLLGNEHTEVAHALHLLAWNINLRGKHAEAEALSREEVVIWQNVLDKEHPNVAWALGDRAVFLRDQKKFAEAEEALREALAIRQKRLKPGHPDISRTLNFLNEMLRKQGKRVESLK